MIQHNESMMLQTPFHSRVAAACETNKWDNWKGYTTPNSYTELEQEYFAIRNSAGVFDLSPMTKYRISGPDSEAFLNRLVTRDVRKLEVGRVAYSVWCNEAGQVMDDGTIFHLAKNDYRLCAYTRMMDWMMWSALGFDVRIEDETAEVAALAIQGPTSCSVLKALGLKELETLRPFGIREYPFEQVTLTVSRTGFTGDLGYELWIDPAKAEALWDQLFASGKDFGILPIGGAALELARVEAGFLQAGVDFVPAEDAVRQGRTRSPFELGLDWLVSFDKPVFNGRRALQEEKKKGSRYCFVYLDVEGNKPAEHSFILKNKKEVGTVTSAAWCPTAKSNIAFAQIDAAYGNIGEELVAEIYYQRELKWTKVLAKCTVIENVVFSPPRRRQTPAVSF
ncbi:MAG: aminomethyl transferase family protein [Gammaproteobacteria bacterium]|jgi:aminomethyltransferase|nr:aminomethyl transferase family protein [Gammaproteobacteria bacterium]MBT3858981.1 aminomethyl transferase family protein [Gammaproteobacteria bacterium]MBT3988067.1 aminomethyl transferase family protein [Gammaproteobacteria bacterium]MBT4582998.1 aminomethyl transferase family protein [Gammaproteobacteria bacterium]MBT4658795.1 aminomethyl transferase family protein [Gammaproteobacteria bacterium]